MENNLELLKEQLNQLTQKKETELSKINDEIKKIEQEFEKLLQEHKSFIPENMKDSINFKINSDCITVSWQSYEDKKYTNSLDAYYYKPNFFSKNKGGYWKISNMSTDTYITLNEQDAINFSNEHLDRMKLSIGLHHFISANSQKIAELHEKYYQCQLKIYELNSPIRELGTKIKNIESEFEQSKILDNFKEKEQWLLNKVIILPSIVKRYFGKKRVHKYKFNAVQIIRKKRDGSLLCNFLLKIDDERLVFVTKKTILPKDLAEIWQNASNLNTLKTF